MSSEDNAPARITNREIYDGLMELKDIVTKLVEKSDADRKTLQDHETRLRGQKEDHLALREEVRVFKGRVALLGMIGFPVLTAVISVTAAYFIR